MKTFGRAREPAGNADSPTFAPIPKPGCYELTPVVPQQGYFTARNPSSKRRHMNINPEAGRAHGEFTDLVLKRVAAPGPG